MTVTATTEGVVVAVSAKKGTFAEVAALAVAMLRTPEVTEDALKEYQSRTAGRIKAKADDPQAMIPEALGRMVFAEGDPRRPETAEEELAAVGKLKVGDVLAFHREFLGAQGMLGSVVGDVARDDVVRLFTPLVADWKAAKAPAAAPMPGMDGCASPHSRILTPGKPAAFVALVQPLRLNATAADHLALDAATWALFGDALSSRIPSKVREEAALSYMTMGVVQAPLYGDAGVIVVFSATKPENAPKVLGMIRDELALALKDGITEKELASWRKSYGNRVVSARRTTSALSAAWIDLRRAGLDFTFWAGRDKASPELARRRERRARASTCSPRRPACSRSATSRRKPK